MMKDYNSLINKLMYGSPHAFSDKTKKLDFALKCADILFGGLIRIPSIVVAGSKGKGSTCSVIESILRHNGLKTGLFTSPHLVSPLERIKINNTQITEDQFMRGYEYIHEKLKDNIDGLSEIPFFGLNTLLSGVIFEEMKPDALIIECGIGGRYDWTQIYHPTLSVITHLELEHTNVLGNTPDSIAYNKAGIIKPGVPAITSRQDGDFLTSLIKYSIQQGSHIKVINSQWVGKIGLSGPPANENTALGSAAAVLFGQKIDKVIDPSKGCDAAKIFGRFQTLNSKIGIRFLLDGAHTPQSIEMCNKWYKKYRSVGNDILLCATTRNRNPNILFKPLIECNMFRRVVHVSNKIYSDSFEMKGAHTVNELIDGIKYIKSVKPDNVLVTGSLHLVGDTLKILDFKPQ